MKSLADEIIAENIAGVRAHLQAGIDLNALDEYGFTYLIEAAVANNLEITRLLLSHGALVNLSDETGNTALHWAAENNNVELCKFLLDNGANPNAYTFSGQSVLVMPLLRRQRRLKQLLLKYGADIGFTRDYINTKLLGHMFELVGTADLIAPDNNFVEVDFEGFFLEFSVNVIADSLKQFTHHYGARRVRAFNDYSQIVVAALERAASLTKYMQYRVNVADYTDKINALIQQEPLIIPIGYEGHAITFLKIGNILAQCDRREDSHLFDNIMIYQVNNPRYLTTDFIRDFMYEKKSARFVNVEIQQLLRLQPLTELKIEAQVSGNCSWANVEASIPTLLFLLLLAAVPDQQNTAQLKAQALEYFQQWREWNRNRALKFCINSFKEDDSIRNSCKAEVLAAILFQACKKPDLVTQERIEAIMEVLLQPDYKPVLDNYIRVYCYESFGAEGKEFLQLIKRFGYSER